MKKTSPAAEQSHSRPERSSLVISLVIGVVLIVGLLAAFEIVSRSSWFTRAFPVRSYGVYHSQFEIKWFKLQDYVRDNGGVDVILLGNSLVNTGINPDILASEYEKLTGQKLRIFNFGIEGLTVAPNSILAKVVVDKYHPGTLLFVTEMRDYVAENGLEVENNLLSDEWVASLSGAPLSTRAWLKTNSTALQHLLPLRNWSRFDFLDNFLMTLRRYGETSDSGYEADRNTGENIDVPPDPNDPEEVENFELFSNFQIDRARLDSLKGILNFSANGTAVFITEMPVYPTYFTYFGGQSVHTEYLSELVPFITSGGGVYLPMLHWEMIPLNQRVDAHHLNYKGARLFSRLLAQQLAESCLQDDHCLLPAGDS